MKILILLILSLLYLAGFAQQEKSDTLLKAAITTIGKPDGAQTEIKIGIDGGSLVSSDGKAELIIPEGSVTKKTSFSIQPVTNTVPNGNGKAYRLEPSGIQFKKPVQLVFHYDEEESKDSMQLLMGIAMQDDKGQWYGLKNFALDTVAKTITGNISHFSDWSNFNKIKLYPSYGRLKVKKSLDMEIDVVSSEDEDISPLTPSGDERAPLKKRKIPWTSIWNKTAGTLKVQSKTTATFTAPATIPNQNPVAVTVNLNGLTYKYKGTVFSTLKLVSNILIYDNAYEVKMISSMGAGSSKIRFVAKKEIVFFIKTSGDVIDLTSYIKLYQFIPVDQYRTVTINSKEGILADKDEAKGKLMSFSVKMLSKDNYQLQLPDQLESGEYGFVWVKNMEVKEFTVFAFGIDWRNSD